MLGRRPTTSKHRLDGVGRRPHGTRVRTPAEKHTDTAGRLWWRHHLMRHAWLRTDGHRLDAAGVSIPVTYHRVALSEIHHALPGRLLKDVTR